MYNPELVQTLLKITSHVSDSYEQLRAEKQVARAIDDQILGYFVGEAKESLRNIECNIAHLTEDPCGIWYLPSIHRQIKTLRENSKMIGLISFHEAISLIEPVILIWLRQGRKSNEQFLDFMNSAFAYMNEWVGCIESDLAKIPSKSAILSNIHKLQSADIPV